MAIPLRSDNQASGEHSLGRRPILLARLPRMGEVAAVDEIEPTLAIVSEEPTFVASAPEQGETSYFVDPGHVRGSAETATAVEQTDIHGRATVVSSSSSTASSSPSSPSTTSSKKRKRRTKSSSSRSSQTKKQFSSRSPQPTGLAASFCKIHEQIAPFAGAIVALALVSAAGLMYWMILSPAPGANNYPNIANGGSDVSPVEIPSFIPRSNPSPMPGNTSMAAPSRSESESLEELLAGQTAQTQALSLNSMEEGEAEKPPAEELLSVGDVAMETPPAVEATEAVTEPALEQTEAPRSAEVVSSLATQQPEVPATETPVQVEQLVEIAPYSATSRQEALNFSVVLAAGKGGLLEQPAAPAVSTMPVKPLFAPARR